jgi:NADH:ubiquinone oxidoreductase subunit E
LSPSENSRGTSTNVNDFSVETGDKSMLDTVDDPRVVEILAARGRDKSQLIPILQEVQGVLGYLPGWAIECVAKHLRVSGAETFGIVTFFQQFRTTQRGEKLVRVCRGTACHVRGGAGIRKAVEDALCLAPGETTPDMKFSYETIACIGACGLAPVMSVESTIYGEMTPARATEILDSVRGEGG